MNINLIVSGMTPQEKAIYFKHMAKRHKEEAEKIAAERARMQSYKQSLILEILEKRSNDYTKDQLEKKSIRTLENLIFD